MRKAIVSYGSAATYPQKNVSHASSKYSLCTYNEILIRLVWGFSLLFPGAHEPPARDDARLDLRQVDLDHHTLLSRLAVAYFRHAIPRPPNLEEHLTLHARLLRGDLQLALLHVARRAPCEVRLVFLALGVREVGALVRVKGEAETTFQRSEMVAQDIRVLYGGLNESRGARQESVRNAPCSGRRHPWRFSSDALACRC
jgi:hypothetical protein